MFERLILISTLLTACASAVPTPTSHLNPRVPEPLRSQFVLACSLGGGLPVTACLCFEEVLVKLKGTDANTFTQLDMAVAQQKCMEVLTPIMRKEMEDLMRQEMEKEKSLKEI